MRRSTLVRAPSATTYHPPYGLYVDPHHNRHWDWMIEPNFLVGLLVSLLSVVGAVGFVLH